MSKVSENELSNNLKKKLINYVVLSTTDNISYIGTCNSISSYFDGLPICVKFPSDSMGKVSVNINGLGSIDLVDYSGNTVSDIKSNNIINLRYESNTGNFILQGKGGGTLSETDLTELIEILNNEEVNVNTEKSKLADILGSPILATDSWDVINDNIQNSKDILSTILNKKGILSNDTESLDSIIEKMSDSSINNITKRYTVSSKGNINGGDFVSFVNTGQVETVSKSAGTELEVATNVSYTNLYAVVIDDTRILVVWIENSTGYGKACILQLLGNTLSIIGSVTTIVAQMLYVNMPLIKLVKTGTDKFVAAYQLGHSYYSMTITTTSNIITTYVPLIIGNSADNVPHLISLDGSRVLFLGRTSEDPYYHQAIVLTQNTDNTISSGIAYNYSSLCSYIATEPILIDTNKVITTIPSSTTNETIFVISISGTSISSSNYVEYNIGNTSPNFPVQKSIKIETNRFYTIDVVSRMRREYIVSGVDVTLSKTVPILLSTIDNNNIYPISLDGVEDMAIYLPYTNPLTPIKCGILSQEELYTLIPTNVYRAGVICKMSNNTLVIFYTKINNTTTTMYATAVPIPMGIASTGGGAGSVIDVKVKGIVTGLTGITSSHETFNKKMINANSLIIKKAFWETYNSLTPEGHIETMTGTYTAGKVVELRDDGNIYNYSNSIYPIMGVALSSTTVLLKGILIGQVGLVLGRKYYCNTDGSITSTNTGKLIGKAISSTELLIQDYLF